MGTGVVIAIGVGMISVGGFFLYFLLRNNEGYRPRDMVEFIGSGLSVLLIASALGLLILAASTNNEAATIQEQISAMQDISMEVPAGEFTFTGLRDEVDRTLATYRGKVVLVNFWATWCVPCLSEIPDLNELYLRHRDEGLVVISISDENPAMLKAFEVQLPMVTERMVVPEFIQLPAPFTGAMVVRPTSYIIDREGTVRRYLLGAKTLDFFEAAVRPYL